MVSGVQIGGDGEGLPCPFFKIKDSAPNLEKGPDFVHFGGKFSIQNVVIRVSRKENSKMFLCERFFYYVFNKMFIKVP